MTGTYDPVPGCSGQCYKIAGSSNQSPHGEIDTIAPRPKLGLPAIDFSDPMKEITVTDPSGKEIEGTYDKATQTWTPKNFDDTICDENAADGCVFRVVVTPEEPLEYINANVVNPDVPPSPPGKPPLHVTGSYDPVPGCVAQCYVITGSSNLEPDLNVGEPLTIVPGPGLGVPAIEFSDPLKSVEVTDDEGNRMVALPSFALTS